jgi:DNA repair protein RecN (Recombination protein N)
VQKYGDGVPAPDPVAAVLQKREELAGLLHELQTQDQDASQIDRRIEELDRQMQVSGEKLTLARRKAAKQLAPLIEKQLAELGMAEAKLDVQFEREEDQPSGWDRIEFVVQTNPGQDARPMRKIASGGELSRTMLAIKSVLASRGDGQRISVLVFDEIDANIGGRLGSVIGQKLRGLAKGPKGQKKRAASTPAHQILCITHLPQIAAFADRHFHIVKSVVGRGKTRQTQTTVQILEGDQRVAELAEMMAGTKVTATSRKQAEELLAAAG